MARHADHCFALVSSFKGWRHHYIPNDVTCYRLNTVQKQININPFSESPCDVITLYWRHQSQLWLCSHNSTQKVSRYRQVTRMLQRHQMPDNVTTDDWFLVVTMTVMMTSFHVYLFFFSFLFLLILSSLANGWFAGLPVVAKQEGSDWPSAGQYETHKEGRSLQLFFSSANREGSYLCMIRLGKKFCIDTMTSSTHTSIALRKKRTSNMKPSYCKSFLTDSI